MLAQGSASSGNHNAAAMRNNLYMRLGGDNQPEPEFGATEASCGDVFLICSDGFWATVQPKEVMHALDDCPIGEGGANRLMELARQRAGKHGDNISFALAQWTSDRGVGVQRLVSRLMSSKG